MSSRWGRVVLLPLLVVALVGVDVPLVPARYVPVVAAGEVAGPVGDPPSSPPPVGMGEGGAGAGDGSTAGRGPELVAFDPPVVAQVPTGAVAGVGLPVAAPGSSVSSLPVVPDKSVSPVSVGFDPVGSVEVVGRRGEFWSEYRNPDGSTVVRLSSLPVNFQDRAGRWQQIDNRVVADRVGGLVNVANGWQVSFRAMTDGGVSFDTPDGPVRFWAEGASSVLPVVEPDGVSVRYVDVVPGSDLVYRVNGRGVEEYLFVKAPSSTASVGISPSSGQVVMTLEGTAVPSGWVGCGRGWNAVSSSCTS